MSFTVIDLGEEHDLGLIEKGSINEWFGYEIRRVDTQVTPGKREAMYRLFVEGDWEADLKTMEETRGYIRRLKQSWRDQ